MVSLKKHTWQSLREHLLSQVTMVEEGELKVTILLEECSGKKGLALRYSQETPDDEQLQQIAQAVTRLQKGEPIPYILGKVDFYGFQLVVTPNTLIPRPETEELVDYLVKHHPSVTRITDYGTGSGCIALALASALPEATVTATDVCPLALSVARGNSRSLQLEHRVTFYLQDITLEDSPPDPYTELVVSNPPYIPPSQKGEVDTHVMEYEPHKALFVPEEDPLFFYRNILKNSSIIQTPSLVVAFEINPHYANDVWELMNDWGYQAQVIQDISGKNRFVIGERMETFGKGG
jgi:release factor glutamine methyltransferase